MKSLQALCVSLFLGANQVNCTILGSKMSNNMNAANASVPVKGVEASLAYYGGSAGGYNPACGCPTVPEITCCKFDATYVYSDPKLPPSGGVDSCC